MAIPTPRSDETEAEFVKRAHYALADEIPDAEERNVAVFKAWKKHRGESDAERRASQRFGDTTKYARIDHVPVFKEHEYPRVARERNGQLRVDDDGNPVYESECYDFEALAAIVENMNHRIEDTNDFCPITDKHSPRKGSEESKPRILGFSGPFRLGQVGNKDPKWAIFAQEHWFADKAHMAREMPRRSAEVFLGRPMHDRVLDPITALGADTPALDMGIHYSQHDGELVAHYSGPPLLARYNAAAAFPGGGNVCPPSEGGKKKPYAAGEQKQPAPDPNQPETGSMISPEDANELVKIFLQTELMQRVQQFFAQQDAAAPQDPAMGGVPGGPPAAAPAAPVAGGPPDVPAEDAPPPVADETPDSPPPPEFEKEKLSEEDSPDTKEPPMAKDDDKAEYSLSSLREQLRAERARYSALEARVAANERENAATKRDATLKSRHAALQAMRLQGYDIDVDCERERCSLETMPTEQAFQNHLDVLAKYSQRILPNVTLFTPDLPEEVARYSRGDNESGREPDFVHSEEFRDEVQRMCEAEQAKPDWNPNDRALYSRMRAQAIENRRKAGGAATKVS